MRRRRSTWLATALLVLAPAEDVTKAAPGRVAVVGATAISQRDVALRTAVEQAYGNDDITAGAVLVMLVNDALDAEVARAAGVTPTQEEIAALSAHADESSKAPEALAAVKGVFGDDREAYDRLYLAPKVANEKLRELHSRSAEIHATERAQIERAFRVVMAGAPLEGTARALGPEYIAGEPTGEATDLPPALSRYFPGESAKPTDPLAAVLEGLAEGAVYPNIIEDQRCFRVVRLVAREYGRPRTEAIVVAKRPCREWFESMAANIAIRIIDEELAKRVVASYPNLWWLVSRLQP